MGAVELSNELVKYWNFLANNYPMHSNLYKSTSLSLQ